MDLLFTDMPGNIKPKIEEVTARFRLDSEWFERTSAGATRRLRVWRLAWWKRKADYKTVPR